MTTQAFLQVIASGLLMGLIYALIAVGLSLIFGLMDVVNFAHGEFLMLAMYATFGLVFMTALDPVVLAPLVVALMFVLGVSAYAESSAMRCAPRPTPAWCRSSRPSVWRF